MMELNATMSKEFYTLSISIYKYLHLPKTAREINEKDYLNKVYSQYTKLCENSQLLKQRFKNDHLGIYGGYRFSLNVDFKYRHLGHDVTDWNRDHQADSRQLRF